VASDRDRLLTIKLATPRPSRKLIHRPRLVELLSRALDARLILVSAPPGFGKTTTLIDWLAAQGIRSTWVSLDEADNEPARFLRYLWAGAATIAGQDGGTIREGGPTCDVSDVVAEAAMLLAEGLTRRYWSSTTTTSSPPLRSSVPSRSSERDRHRGMDRVREVDDSSAAEFHVPSWGVTRAFVELQNWR
jgi:hypothetical protein